MNLDLVRGQERATRLLGAFLRSGNMPTAFLFSGPAGVGKALAAYEFAKALVGAEDARHPDIKAVNAAYQASLREEEEARQRTWRVETIRHLRRDMELRSLHGGWKVAVLEDAHALEPESANALLKILEEPPEKTLWILVTAERERLPKTVLSRCFKVPFRPLPPEVVVELLRARGIEPGRAARLAALCDGSVGRALELAGSPGYPDSLLSSAAAVLTAAEDLPKELYLARPQVELALFSLEQDLRSRLRDGSAYAPLEHAFAELDRLRRALRANADPRLILALAAAQVPGVP